MTPTGKYLPLFFFVLLAGIGLFGQSLFVSEASKDPVQQKAAPDTVPGSASSSEPSNQRGLNQESLKERYGKLPMSFERNLGQTDERVKFFSHGRGYNLFLTPAEAVFVLSNSSRAAKDK